MKKRIAIPIVLALVAVLLLGSVAYAAYNFWSGTANVTVEEAMEVYVDSVKQPTGTYTWAVNTFPSASVSKSFIVRNVGSANLDVTPIATPVASADGKVTTAWLPAVTTTILPGAGNQVTFSLTVTAAGDAVPGVYGFTASFTRE